MPSKRPAPSTKSNRLIELGPALTGLGTFLAGIAAIVALVVVRPDASPAPSPPPTEIASPGGGSATDAPPSTQASDVPTPAATPLVDAITLDDLILELRALAARTGVPTEPEDHGASVVVGPQAGLLAEMPKAWPTRLIDLWSDVPPDAPSGGEREPLGSILFATTDEPGLFTGTPEAYRIEMLIVSASRSLATDFRPGSILDMRNATLGLDCDKEASGPIEVAGYRGLYEIFSRCGDSTPMTVQLELMADDESHVTAITARIVSLADIDALRHGIDTLRVEPDRLLR